MKKSDITRRRLLAVSIQKFSEKGLAGTSVDEIVDAAKVNKRMVYHYFGSKEKLYQAALKDIHERPFRAGFKPPEEGSQIQDIIKKLIERHIKFLQENPEFVKLVLWENLNQGRCLEAADFELAKDPTAQHLEEAIREGVETGSIRDDVNVQHLMISLTGLCFVYFSNRYTLSRMFHADLGSKRFLEEAIDHVGQLVLRGILKE